MKRLSTMFFTLAILASVTGEAIGQYEVLWERNQRTGALAAKPSFMTVAGAERGLAYGHVGGNHRIYVASRSGGNNIRVLNADTGADVTLDTPFDMTGIAGGLFQVNDIEVSTDGVIVLTNMTTDASNVSNPFKAYIWTSEGGTRAATYSYTAPSAHRLGDKVFVRGSWSAGTFEIWTPASSTATGIIYVHKTANQGSSWTVETITLSGTAINIPASSSVTTDGNSIFINGNGQLVRRYSMAGVYQASQDINFSGSTTGSQNGVKVFTSENKTHVAVYAYRRLLGSESIIGFAAAFDVSTALSPIQVAESPKLTTAAAGNGVSGDVTVRTNDDGSYVLYALGADQGLIAYNMQKAVTLTGSSGFRTLASPVANTRLSELMSGLWTQGFTGSGNAGASSNVFFHPNGTNNYVSATNVTNTISAGHGVLAAVFADNDPSTGGVQGGFPKTLNVYGTTNTGDVTVTPTHTTGDEYFLAGNPYMATVDWDLVTKGENVYPNVWVAKGDGTGNFDSWNGSVGDLTDGLIAPFQGFFYAYSGATSGVTFTVASQSTGGTFRGKEESPLAFRLALGRDGRETASWLQFAQDGTFGRDRKDVPKMASLSSDLMDMSTTEIGSGAAMDIHYLPLIGEAVELPLGITATRGGDFTLSLGSSTLPAGWLVSVRDAVTGTTTELGADRTLAFRSNSPLSASEPRFTLIIEPSSSTSTKDDGRGTMDGFALEQNYPNPFNPSTQIRFTLQSSNVTRLTVFDLLGREVAVLVNGSMPAGAHSVTFDASNLASGVYVYKLEAGGQVMTRRMTLVK